MCAVKRGGQQWMTGNVSRNSVLLSSAPCRLASTQLHRSCSGSEAVVCEDSAKGRHLEHVDLVQSLYKPKCLFWRNNMVMASGFSIRAANEVCVSLCVLYCLDCLVAQLCLILCDPVDCSPPGSSVRGISRARILGVGCHFLLQGIFLTHLSNQGLLYWQVGSFTAEPLGKLHCFNRLFLKISIVPWNL